VAGKRTLAAREARDSRVDEPGVESTHHFQPASAQSHSLPLPVISSRLGLAGPEPSLPNTL